MKKASSFPRAAAGAGIVYAIYAFGWFTFGARGCHDLSWGLVVVIAMSVIGSPVWALLAVLGGAIAVRTPPESQHKALLLALAIVVVMVIVILITVVPQAGPCRFDM